MKAFYPKHLDKIMHVSQDGRVYQLDAFWKMEEIYKELRKQTNVNIEIIDKPHADEEVFKKFHTTEFAKALTTGWKKEQYIESCGVLWQDYLPLAMTNRAHANIGALEELVLGDEKIALLIADAGHHTIPNKAYGFGPINSLGIAINTILETFTKLKIAVLDLDTHQGNGFSFINNPNTFIYDIWHQRLDKWEVLESNPNYASFKVNKIEEYFEILDKAFAQIKNLNPDILVYYTGVDILETDRLGGIKGFTDKLLEKRESKVREFIRETNLPTMISIGGGYVDYRDKEKVEENRKDLIRRHMVIVDRLRN